MLSDEKILQYIREYSKTAEGKQTIEQYKRDHGMPRPKSFVARYVKGADRRITKKYKQEVANDMCEILYKYITTSTATEHGDGLKSFERSAISVGKTEMVDDVELIKIQFDKAALNRDSLDPSRFDGVDNIISLFVHGYNARGSVCGVWKNHGEENVWSLSHREPNDFMQAAIAEFNAKYRGVAVADLTAEYK